MISERKSQGRYTTDSEAIREAVAVIDVLMVVAGVSWVSSLAAWPTFFFLSVRRIEAKVRADGRDRTGWDGIGSRVPLYALVLCVSLPKKRVNDYPLIDIEAVRQYATPRDKRLAMWLTISLLTMTISAVWGGSLL
jgi:hypothetical protein